MRNNLRPLRGEVKRTTPTSCGRQGEERNIVGKYSILQPLTFHGPAESDRCFSAAVPPHFHEFSTGYPQFFQHAEFTCFPPECTRSPQLLPLVFRTLFNNLKPTLFINFSF
jgi:hypothetical protein